LATLYDVIYFDCLILAIGLALALKATAVDLIVAIPAVLLCNPLLRRVKVLIPSREIVNGRE
jgi:biopolymer transport protein ExbB